VRLCGVGRVSHYKQLVYQDDGTENPESPLRMPKPPKMMLKTAIAVIPPVRRLCTLASKCRIVDGDVADGRTAT
jgi:hypothetical protein